MKKTLLAALAFAALGATSFAASAGTYDNNGPYVGLNYNSVHLSCSDCNGTTESSPGFFAGYRSGNLAGEISTTHKTVDGDKYTITDFAAVPHMKIAADLDVIGKVGIRHSNVNNSMGNHSGNSLVIGAGVEYSFNRDWAARGLIDYSSKTFGESIKDTTTTIGVSYKF